MTPPLLFVGGVNRCFRKAEVNGALCNPEGAGRNQTFHSKPQTRSQPLGGDLRVFIIIFFIIKKSQVFLEVLLPDC